MPRRPARKVLTDFELAVMREVWACAPRAVTVREIVERLNQSRSEPLAYNTVQTMLTILREKGVVKVARGPGRAHVFTARASQEEVTSNMVGELVDKLFDGRVRPLLVELMSAESLNRQELEELQRLIETRLDDEAEP